MECDIGIGWNFVFMDHQNQLDKAVGDHLITTSVISLLPGLLGTNWDQERKNIPEKFEIYQETHLPQNPVCILVKSQKHLVFD